MNNRIILMLQANNEANIKFFDIESHYSDSKTKK